MTRAAIYTTFTRTIMRGPFSWYRPKDTTHPLTVCLTVRGRQALDVTRARTSASSADVVEQLLIRFAHLVDFPTDKDAPE